MVVTKGVAQHMGVDPRHVQAGEALESSGGYVTGHAGAVAAEQDRT
jgi:hypothetical protein